MRPDHGDLLRLVVRVTWSTATGPDLATAPQAAEAGGATAVLLGGAFASARELARAARLVTERCGLPLLLDGRADLAIAIGAAGVHLGAGDIPVPMVRRIAPRGFLVGASVGSIAEVEAGRGADYWAVGPWPGGSFAGDTGPAAVLRRLDGRAWVAAGLAEPQFAPLGLAAGAAGIVVEAQGPSPGEISRRVRAWAE